MKFLFASFLLGASLLGSFAQASLVDEYKTKRNNYTIKQESRNTFCKEKYKSGPKYITYYGAASRRVVIDNNEVWEVKRKINLSGPKMRTMVDTLQYGDAQQKASARSEIDKAMSYECAMKAPLNVVFYDKEGDAVQWVLEGDALTRYRKSSGEFYNQTYLIEDR